MNRIILLFSILFLVACGGLKDVSKFKKEDIVFSLKKGACFGKCSVYNLDVYKNGYVVFEGIANVEKYGIYARKITKQELQNIKMNFDKENFYGFDDNYPIAMSDLPTITMTYNKENMTKTVQGSINRPQQILNLQKNLEKLIKSNEFKQIKAYLPQTTQETESEKPASTEDVIIDSQIIVELNNNVFMAQWLRKYSQYDMQLVKQVSPDLNYWVITYNKQKIVPDDMMKIIKEDSQVKLAEFNKRVSNRAR